MRLYLVQHGLAKSEAEDPERPLTERGAEEVRRVASHAVQGGGLRVPRVLHSGKTRARQTAEIWAGCLGVAVEPAKDLAPNDNPTAWAERLRSSKDDLLLVGHLPHLARLAGLLLTGRPDLAVVQFRPGGLVGLDRAEAGWAVSLVLPPEAS